MAFLNSREAIESRKPKTIKVTLPDGDDSVTVRRWSASDWDRAKADGADENNTGVQLAMVICDDNGNRLYNPDNEEDCRKLADMFGIDEAGAIVTAAGKLIVKKEETAKKSEASPSTDSATA